MSVKVTDKDNGFRKIVKALVNGGKPYVQVGIFGPEGEKPHEGGDLTVLEVAAFHEFGLGNNPERSFVRAWADENQDKVIEFLKKEQEKAAKAGSRTAYLQGLERLGLYCQAGMQQRMADGIPPPLKDATVKRKGSSTPLIDTGQLRSSITYKVIEDGE